jgi:hypothetical protein
MANNPEVLRGVGGAVEYPSDATARFKSLAIDDKDKDQQFTNGGTDVKDVTAPDESHVGILIHVTRSDQRLIKSEVMRNCGRTSHQGNESNGEVLVDPS